MNNQLLAIQCRMEAIKAQIEAMKAKNANCAHFRLAPYWTEDDFNEYARQLSLLAEEALNV